MDSMQIIEIILAIAIGVALAAACGFRVFVPMLVLSIASMAQIVTLAEAFAWIGTWPALIVFLVATILEVGAYYIPWLDNALDAVAIPAAVIAGIIVSASFMLDDMNPMLAWALAILAGGGSAGVIKGGTATVRLASTAGTGGLGNFVVATLELAISVTVAVLAIAVPVCTALLVLLILGFFAWFIVRRFCHTSECRPRPLAVLREPAGFAGPRPLAGGVARHGRRYNQGFRDLYRLR